jgi:hypothetical protein
VAGGVAVTLALGAAAVGLGHVLTSGGPLSVVDLHRPPVPAVVRGTAGLAPGGPAVPVVFVAGGHPSAVPLTVSSVAPVAAGLPLACPPPVWHVQLPARVRIDPAVTPIRVPATVALADDAPPGCQGLAVEALVATVSALAPDGTPVALDSTADRPLRVATLGTPGIAVGEESGKVMVAIAPDAAAPPGVHYTVESENSPGRWTALCRLTEPGPCATGHRADRGDDVRYRVTARLGSYWRRASAAIRP